LTIFNFRHRRQAYYSGRALEALGKGAEARQVYEKGVAGVPQLSGDRDSWNSENYFMVLSLDRLGRSAEATALEKHFENFAQSELDAKTAEHRAEARYLARVDPQTPGPRGGGPQADARRG
jgi:hypothetical protein